MMGELWIQIQRLQTMHPLTHPAKKKYTTMNEQIAVNQRMNQFRDYVSNDVIALFSQE
jgi:hypothetical protein